MALSIARRFKMPGKIYKREKLQSLAELASSLFTDLKAIGLTQVLPATGQNFTPTNGTGKFVLESVATINPVQAKQPWRILVDLDGAANGAGRLRIAIANPQQISNSGNTSSFPGAPDTTGARTMGQLGAAWTTSTKIGDAFLNRSVTNKVYDSGTTVSYLMVATNRGLSLMVWEDASDAAPVYSFFCVQSPVNKETGEPLTDLNSPIFCVYNADNSGIKKFVISESDVFRPTPSVPADRDGVNSAAIINSQEQVAIARGNRYLVTFPNRLNTDRYAYTEELDMFAYTSADVIGEESEISVTVYGESTPRVYRAMKANDAYNTGMRILMLVEGGGVPAV
jgi:hypothetical protein